MAVVPPTRAVAKDVNVRQVDGRKTWAAATTPEIRNGHNMLDQPNLVEK